MAAWVHSGIWVPGTGIRKAFSLVYVATLQFSFWKILLPLNPISFAESFGGICAPWSKIQWKRPFTAPTAAPSSPNWRKALLFLFHPSGSCLGVIGVVMVIVEVWLAASQQRHLNSQPKNGMDGWMVVVVFYDKSMYNFLTLCSHCCYDHFYNNGPCSMTLKRPRKENKLGELSPKEICAHCRGRPISLSCYLPLPHLPLPFQLTTKQTIKPFGNQVWLVDSVFLPQNDTGHLTILRRFWTPTQVKTEALGLLIQERCLWDHRMSAI